MAIAAKRQTLRWRTVLLTVLIIFLNSLGDLSLKWGMRQIPDRVGIDPVAYLRAFLNPFVALGVAMLVLWLLTRMTLMSWADLSFVLPVSSLGYVLAAFLGRLFLDEPVTIRQWAGTFFIFAGAALVGTSTQRTVGPAIASSCEVVE